MTRYALRLAYDGSNFCGWAPQPQQRSVSEHCQQALQRLGEKNVSCYGSSRTDAGVHARCQVAHIDCQRKWPALDLLRALNQQFDHDLSCTAIAHVTDDWQAIAHCVNKTYRYSIDCGPVADPLLYAYSWRPDQIPQLTQLHPAAALIPGTHNWQAFARSNDSRDNFTREITSCNWHQDGALLHCDITGTGFIYRLVRSLAGAMIACATEQCSFADLHNAINGSASYATNFQAPARGLCLTTMEHQPAPQWIMPE